MSSGGLAALKATDLPSLPPVRARQANQSSGCTTGPTLTVPLHVPIQVLTARTDSTD
tara:strand:+ start:222 stop:392 length:171 start_codon:yes stop_codon:yes gene_type:complete